MTAQSSQTAPVELARLPHLDLSELHLRLARLTEQPPGNASSLPDFLKLAVTLVNAGGAVFFSATQQGLSEADRILSRQAFSWSADLEAEIRRCADVAVRNNKSGFTQLTQFPQAVVIAAPVFSGGQARGCLCVVVLLAGQAAEPFLAIVQLLGAYLGLWLCSGSDGQMRERKPVVVRIARIMSKVMRQDDRRQAELVLVNELKEVLGCDTVMLAVRTRGRRMALRTVSDVTTIDLRTEYAGAAQEVLDECGMQQKTLCWPESSLLRSIPSPICGNLVRSLNACMGVCLPLPNAGERLEGACIFLWTERPDDRVLAGQITGTLAEILAGGLAALARRPAPFRRLKHGKTGRRGKFKSVMIAGLIVAGVAALLLFPLPYRVKGPCTVTPVVTRYVTARFDGILENVYRKPGTVVKKGELLARMDGRVIELDLTTLSAELKKARKMRDVHLASGDTAAAQIAVLEGQRLEQKIKLQMQRKQQLDITSPIDGIVLTGSLERVEGSPVRRGQSLFEISPLENMMVEVAISQDDISHARPGMPVRVEFDAYPRRRWEAVLDTILPRSEIRGGLSVFVGQAAFANPDGRLRPGMRGKASIISQPRSIAWITFHRPWNALLSALNL